MTIFPFTAEETAERAIETAEQDKETAEQAEETAEQAKETAEQARLRQIKEDEEDAEVKEKFRYLYSNLNAMYKTDIGLIDAAMRDLQAKKDARSEKYEQDRLKILRVELNTVGRVDGERRLLSASPDPKTQGLFCQRCNKARLL